MERSPIDPERRRALGGLAAFGLATALPGCADNPPTPVSDLSGTTTGGSCVLIPRENTGPYPLSAVLDDLAITRRAIAEDRPGLPLQLVFKLHNVDRGCAPIADARVYVWHCDKDGLYSGYRQGGRDESGETYCRGVQTSDAEGQVVFDTIYPGWYPGRVTHAHFQVWVGRKQLTSQLAFPLATNRAVYATEHYNRGQNNTVSRLADDFEFADDGAVYQTVSVSGTPESGLVATLEVGLSAG